MNIFLKCIAFCALMALFFADVAIAQQRPRVAVLDFSSDSVLAFKAEQLALSYSEVVRNSEFFSLVEPIITDSAAVYAKSPQVCRSLECLVALGTYLGADYILYGDLAMLNDIYVVNVMLFYSNDGKIVSRDYYVYAGELTNMLENKIDSSFFRLSKGIIASEPEETFYTEDSLSQPLTSEDEQTETVTDFYAFLSDSAACAKEHARGKKDASTQHRSIGWMAGGFAAGAFASIIGAAIVAAVATNVDVEPPPESRDINFCYNAGYSEYAERRNITHALYGASAGIAVFFIFAYLNRRE